MASLRQGSRCVSEESWGAQALLGEWEQLGEGPRPWPKAEVKAVDTAAAFLQWSIDTGLLPKL